MTEEKKPGRNLIPNSPDLDDADQEAIKAVKAFEKIDRSIALFEAEHGEIFRTYAELLDKREKKRKVADAAIRATTSSFGPWQLLNIQHSYDIPTLCSLVGEDKFLELGGTVTKMPVYELGKDELELAIAANKIPATVIAEIQKLTPQVQGAEAKEPAVIYLADCPEPQQALQLAPTPPGVETCSCDESLELRRELARVTEAWARARNRVRVLEKQAELFDKSCGMCGSDAADLVEYAEWRDKRSLATAVIADAWHDGVDLAREAGLP